MIDISKFKLPANVDGLAKKINQYIALRELLRKDIKIALYNEDYETLDRFTRKVSANRYTIREATWKGYAITKGRITK